MANAIWQATIVDQSGNVLPGAEVEVVDESTGLSAPLFTTRTGTTKSNPFFADANGFAQFYAAPGLYRITATSSGTGTTITWRYVRLIEVGTSDVEIQTNSQNRAEFAAISGGAFTTDIDVNGLLVGRGGGSQTTNTASGRDALSSNTTGLNNTASGRDALSSNTEGYNNTANGRNALSSNTTGLNNTASGFSALSSNTIFSNCSGLGVSAQTTGDNQVQLGNASTTTYAYGAVQDRSDIRDKSDVRDTALGLDFINALRPVDFRWDMREDYRQDAPEKSEGESDEAFKSRMDEWLESVKLGNIEHDGTHKRSRYHHGLIAQEVKAVIDASGIDFGGFQDHKLSGGDDVLSLGYEELIAPLIKAVQELTARVDTLESKE